ncbi:hypothetical protein PBY51_004075 [Eleginops maclovinus]|uniref:WW-binding domain-containing protein n=1 Tax=Eleginops maclovinus TaxID=56733 RepID=A0AAN8AQB4_ELEMC|nr:hypothetical protein PBY51_004075 [Eleginops maclovinus]
MAKRRADDTFLHEAPNKRCYRSLSSADLNLDSMDPTGGGVSDTKRPYHFEKNEKQEAAALNRKPTDLCDTMKHAANILTVQTSGSSQDRHNSSELTHSKKRPRDDCTSSETVVPKADDKADEDPDPEDCTFNCFQYWRVPLPKLDLSLLKDANENSQGGKDESKVKDSSPYAMET